MCGRFALGLPKKTLEEHFGCPFPREYAPEGDISPGRDIVCVAGTARRAGPMHWGFLPEWARPGMRPVINARAETAWDKPFFARAMASRRVLVPAQAFYEWDAAKAAHAFFDPDGRPLALGAVWERGPGRGGEPRAGLAVLTCEANQAVAQAHPRMPVLLAPADFNAWLDPKTGPEEVRRLCAPWPAHGLEVRAGSFAP